MKVAIKPDPAKAKSLKEISVITLARLKDTDIEKYPSNTLKDYYDIIRGLMEALLYLKGIKMKGEYAHYEVIEYACKEYGLGESSRRFLQDMRDYRNRISYEGFNVQKSYILLNLGRINTIIQTLLNLIEERLKNELG